MTVHVQNRLQILRALREELVGPSVTGKHLDCSIPVIFADWEETGGPWIDKGTGEEILASETPSQRYGVGVLYPLTQMEEEQANPETLALTEHYDLSELEPRIVAADESDDLSTLEADTELAISSGSRRVEAEGDDFDLSSANRLNPSSMGISFLVNMPEDSILVVEVPTQHVRFSHPVNGRYEKFSVEIGSKSHNWWVRRPLTIRAEFDAKDIRAVKGDRVCPRIEPESANLGELGVRVEVFARPHGEHQLVTVCLINRTPPDASERAHREELLLFQSHFVVSIVNRNGETLAGILPYPEGRLGEEDYSLSLEEQSLALLYRNTKTYAIGHGCAADWHDPVGDRVHCVSAECLPVFETPTLTAQIRAKDTGEPLEIPMQPLAGLVPNEDGFDQLEKLVSYYEEWIREKRKVVPSLPQRYQRAAYDHLQQCETACQRMRKGLSLLKTDALARRAFQLANHAILLQQIRSGLKRRPLEFDCAKRTQLLADLPAIPDPLTPPPNRGKWRPFQIAFLLMTIESVLNGKSPDREIVELIWFPTGGGKTEAYLALAAFSMFVRRLKNPADAGVEVLMRYTLRLLTTQQFQRAAALTCAMEYLRRQDEQTLGQDEFSIGLWVGGENTPNRRQEAIQLLRKLKRADPKAINKFVVTQCPWCAAQIGPIKLKGKPARNDEHVRGYEESEGTVIFSCTDPECEFHGSVPIYVIDEDIYETRPTFIIGTVDKFAVLAWNEKAKAIFGRDQMARQVFSPPGLIIQDELHLISGPLGSMVGLYETVIEELCTDRRGEEPIPPKIVCSTATIRRYEDQVRALYARTKTQLFPPPGLDASDSFFAVYERREDKTLAPGRMYVGVHAPALGSMQTVQVRTFTALLQAPMELNQQERDPWWTQLNFFNSLRELGTTLTLFQSDIPTRLQVLRRRYNLSRNELRRPRVVRELTSRIKSDQIPEAIDELKRSTTDPAGGVIDVCLASNIIEVGVDIDRLSLMSIVGQPKNTAQYIQVSGRVGRDRTRPGLVVTLYSASKPRDRSHFERFRTYHEQLYAQVEPTSVTPFSRPVLERALHAIMVAYVRQSANVGGPYPIPEEWLRKLEIVVEQRIKLVDPDEAEHIREIFHRRTAEWKDRHRHVWTAPSGTEDPGLLRPVGTHATILEKSLSWPTPTSMRNVDAECKVVVTNLYSVQEERAHG